MSDKEHVTHHATHPAKPESFQRLENFARAILSVPKEEIDAVEKQEAEQNRKRAELQEKPDK